MFKVEKLIYGYLHWIGIHNLGKKQTNKKKSIKLNDSLCDDLFYVIMFDMISNLNEILYSFCL